MKGCEWALKTQSETQARQLALLPIVIVNPASASGSTGDLWPRVAATLRTHFGPFECAFTSKPGDSKNFAATEARSGRLFVIACGGDGTISEVANGLIESGQDTEMGILPSGTGGDFRRTLKIPRRPADAARALLTGRTRRIDVGKFTYQQGESGGSRFFVNVASFGMGGAVVARVKENSSKWLPGHVLGGKASFALAALKTTLALSKVRVRLKLDEKSETSLLITNVCVANGRFFGGGMKIAPEASLNDGLFDVVVIGDMSRLSILGNAHRIYLGTHLGMPQVKHARAKRITVRSPDMNSQMGFEIDGEPVYASTAEFQIIPGALRIRSPL